MEDSKGGYWGWKVDKDGNQGQWTAFQDVFAYHDYLLRYKRSPVIPLEGRILHDTDWQQFAEKEIRERFGVEKGGWIIREKLIP
jgi:hypothetical protein